jgi:hypothetical protein
MTKEEDAELEYLRWFVGNSDFGPTDSDVRAGLNEGYEIATGKKVPKEWKDD